MRFTALATDYDGTLATDGVVPVEVIGALRRFRESGRRVILVTGRTLPSLRSVFSNLDEFDSVVAENGAVLYDLAEKSEKLLAEPPPEFFCDLLRSRLRAPLECGRVIVATLDSQRHEVLNAIQELGLDLRIILNKSSLMVLPPGINKGSGLQAAAEAFGLSLNSVAGVGDAENDQALLSACGFSAAVANALPALKKRVQFVTRESAGRGVMQLIDNILGDDTLKSNQN